MGTLLLLFCIRYIWITQYWVRWRFKEHKISKKAGSQIWTKTCLNPQFTIFPELTFHMDVSYRFNRELIYKVYLGLEWQVNCQTSLVSIISLLLHVPTKYHLQNSHPQSVAPGDSSISRMLESFTNTNHLSHPNLLIQKLWDRATCLAGAPGKIWYRFNLSTTFFWVCLFTDRCSPCQEAHQSGRGGCLLKSLPAITGL